ncbi:hypothetical protein ACFT9I_27145 [Streptomyces sp. NPDC057137]|uniref:hypothetical protein n=1 Tax=Streptomyces sp. NPDC057137 TaxID=3346030 RepID=UPI0036326E06
MIVAEKRPCTREDLQMAINVSSYWGVNADGSMNTGDYCDEGMADADDIKGYYCDNCGEFWLTDWRSREATWAIVLDHLEPTP